MKSTRRLLGSHAARLALLYTLVFGLSAGALLGFLYWSTAGYLASQADQTIAAEIEGLAERYRERGLDGLSATIAERIRRDPRGESVYLFADPEYRALAGNLDRWPRAAQDADGWLDFELDTISGARRARARAFVLSGGLRLLVGRDVHVLEEVQTLYRRAVGWGLALALGLAVAAGLALSRSTLSRIEAINQTSREIMAGDLTRRVPRGTVDDEFDRLATNLNAMLDEIEHLMASVRQVSDNVAHDLRTPLTRLRNRLETLRAEVGVSEPAAELVDAAIADADQLLAAFTALLRIARLEAGRVVRPDDSVDLGALSDDAFELYEAVAESRAIELRRAAAPGCVVRGDRDLLFQALGNLLDNALKFTPAGGRVTLTVERRDARVRLAVADTGPGVEADQRDRIFQRFYRVDPSRSTPGHGLGLALVAAVARHHAAALEVLDNAPGLTVALLFDAPPQDPIAAGPGGQPRAALSLSER